MRNKSQSLRFFKFCSHRTRVILFGIISTIPKAKGVVIYHNVCVIHITVGISIALLRPL